MRLVLVLAYLCLAACGPSSRPRIDVEAEDGARPWTGLDANDADGDFHFAIVSDRTGGARPGVFASAIPKVNILEPAFVVSVGDLIEGYTEDPAQIKREWDEFEGLVAGFETPFFYVAGNHDMNNAVMAEAWKARFGPSYYRFVYRDVLFLVLNSELFRMVGTDESLPGPWSQEEQLAFVKETLAEFPDPRWTVVLVHQPLWDYPTVLEDWLRLEAMLGERDYTVFAGHRHRYVRHVRNDRKYITLATTGGGSSLRGEIYGEFDQVALVTMTDAGPRLANLRLDGIAGEDLVTGPVRDAVANLSSAVRSLPGQGSGDAFDSGSVAFEVANRGNADLHVGYHVDAGPDLAYAGPPSPRVVAPGDAVRIEFPLAAAVPTAWANLRPGRVSWSLETTAGGQPVALTVASALLPVAPLPLPPGPAPTVDGDLGDWGPLRHRVSSQGDVASRGLAPTDLSYRFDVREAGGDLYFAARVFDDEILASSDRSLQTQDAVLVFADARPEPARSANMSLYRAATTGNLAAMAIGYLTLADTAQAMDLGYLSASLAAVEWRARRVDGGYAVEARIDGAFLDEHAGAPWRAVRLGVAAVDWDDEDAGNRIAWHFPGSAGAALHWQPDRFGQAPVAGSGTLVRMNGAAGESGR